jgi:hypothetical protein
VLPLLPSRLFAVASADVVPASLRCQTPAYVAAPQTEPSVCEAACCVESEPQ